MVDPIFSSFGSLIIDDIRYPDGREERNILGGAGIYAIYGMRVWLKPPESLKIAYLAQEGYDLPLEVEQQLDGLDITLQHVRHDDMPTTRGLNIFGANDHRDFEYIHPIIRITALDPPLSWVKSVKIIHIICAPERAIEIVTQWRARADHAPAKFVWEPLPWACLPEAYDVVCKAAQLMDVVTPNHEEAAALLNIQQPGDTAQSIEKYSQILFDDFFIRNPYSKTGNHDTTSTTATTPKSLIVRAGKRGAVVYSTDHTTARWVPAYWSKDPQRVRDVTGAGNTFCGGLCIGLEECNMDPYKACFYGAVSASFAVEQVGLPTCDENSQWNNGKQARERLQEMME